MKFLESDDKFWARYRARLAQLDATMNDRAKTQRKAKKPPAREARRRKQIDRKAA